MSELIRTCVIVCPLVFLAGFVDSVAGGGGLISLPAYLLVGLPVHTAAGTNKVVACIGTSFAAGKYFKEGLVNIRLAAITAVGALVGSYFGTRIALSLNENTLKIVILCVLPAVAVFLAVKKDFGKESESHRKWNDTQEKFLCIAIGLIIGCYDGIIGPGTGTFLMMAFTAVIGFDLLKSTGCAKIVNLASNVASSVVWILNGQILFWLVLPAAAFNIAGNLLGARYAIKGGSKRIRGMIFVVLALMVVKLLYDVLS